VSLVGKRRSQEREGSLSSQTENEMTREGPRERGKYTGGWSVSVHTTAEEIPRAKRKKTMGREGERTQEEKGPTETVG